MKSNGKGPLNGVTVIDLTHMLSGPYCTWLLGSLGASIVKVERREGGDFTRAIAPMIADESLYFMSINRNKRSITLDLKSDSGQDVFRKLVKKADILVENNRAGAMERLGLSPDSLWSINPGLIYASITGFGQDGPYSHRSSFDVVAQAMSGMMSITGDPDGGPCRVGASIGDIGSSLFTCVGILAALNLKRQTGRGSQVDISMLDCQLAIMENAVARTLNTGETPRRLGSRHPGTAPFQAFPTADKPIAICINSNPEWYRLCEALGLENLAKDPRFPTGSVRAKNHSELEPLLIEVLLKKTRAEWMEILDERNIPVSEINTVPEALANPQVIHRKMVTEVPRGSGRRYASSPIKMPKVALEEESPAPRLGEHTDDILRELGYQDDQISALREAQVI